METSSFAQFISLFMFFGFILFILLFVMFYSKWQIYGPRWHALIHKITIFFKQKFDKSKPKVQRGAVIESTSIKEDLDKKESTITNAQELLLIQNERNLQEKQVKALQSEVEMKQQKKVDKVEQKIEKKKQKVEDKQVKKELNQKSKEQKKEKKAKEKEDKKLSKEENNNKENK